MLVFNQAMADSETGAQVQLTEETVGPLTRDPMCGRHITAAQALLRAEHDGRTYLFCAERCRMLFALRPDSVRSG